MILDIQENVPLAPMTTFKIGGPARYFVVAKSEADIREALDWAKERKLRHIIWAGGSNVLVPDEGIEALVMCIENQDLSFFRNTLEADAGCNLLSLIRTASEKGLGGWEKLAGIPGTLGGAVRGNAGAFGPEIKDFAQKVRAFNTGTGDIREFDNAECEFVYRNSFFKRNPEWIVMRVLVELENVDPKDSTDLIARTIEEREKRHIQNVRAAGSFYVNPVVSKEIQEMFEKEKGMSAREGRVPAGWLIEKVGMKGARVGDAVASEQHPNYIKNDGKATAKDVLTLARQIKDAVKEKFGVELKEEAVVL